MSDNDNNTSSNGFASGWTHLIPEEFPVESVGPGDDGIESLTETPSLGSATAPETGDWTAPQEGAMSKERLYDHPVPPEVPVESVGQDDAGRVSPAEIPCISEEMTGSVAMEERGDGVGLPEAIISEKGQQVCPESSSDGSAPSSPAVLSPYSHEPLISNEESEVPFIPPTVTCEATNPCSDSEVLVSASSPPDIYSSISSAPETLAPVNPTPDTCTDTSSAPQSLAEVHTDVMAEPGSAAADACTDISPALEPTALESQSQASMLETQQVDELGKEKVACEPAELLASVTPQEEFCGDSYPEPPPCEVTEEGGLRRRHAPPSFSPEPLGRTREEEEDEEEEEFHLMEKKEEEGSWLSLNKCIVGALVLLCLGSILFTEDDSAQSRDTEHGKQDWPTPDAQLPDPKEVSQLLGKLAEENQQMAILQAQLQKEELDLVLKTAEPTEKEPPAGLTENFSTVYSRVWEGEREPASEKSSAAEEEQGAIEQGQEERRTERVDVSAGREGDRKRQWAERVREFRKEQFQEKDWKKGREDGKERWQGRGEKKEKKREGDWKHRKDGGKSEHREWKEKVEKRRAWEKEKEWQKGGEKKGWKSERKDQRPDRWHWQKKDWKAQKEGWKAQNDWRDERGTGQQKSRKGKHWQGSSESKLQALDQVDYWKHQEEKFWKHRHPVNCHGSAECARKEGLVPVKQAEFEGLLRSYLGKLGDKAGEGKDAITLLVGKFFTDGVFVHDRVPFQEFAEDVEDVLEDLVEGDRQLEDEMEDFEKVALRRFALAVGEGEREGRGRG